MHGDARRSPPIPILSENALMAGGEMLAGIRHFPSTGTSSYPKRPSLFSTGTHAIAARDPPPEVVPAIKMPGCRFVGEAFSSGCHGMLASNTNGVVW
jgi:hypothetical protein